MRFLHQPRVIVLLVVTSAVITTELAASGVSSFWTRHPIFAGVVVGLLLLGIAVWIVEGWITDRSKPIVRQAYRSLGSEMTNLKNVMRWSINGRARTPAGTGLDVRCWEAVQEALTRFDGLPSGQWERLPLLLDAKDWRQTVRDLLRAQRRQLHDRAADWVPVMLASADLTEDLGRLSDLTEDIGRLGQALTVDRDPRAVASLWREVFDQADVLETQFYAAARSERYAARYGDKYRSAPPP